MKTCVDISTHTNSLNIWNKLCTLNTNMKLHRLSQVTVLCRQPPYARTTGLILQFPYFGVDSTNLLNLLNFTNTGIMPVNTNSEVMYLMTESTVCNLNIHLIFAKCLTHYTTQLHISLLEII